MPRIEAKKTAIFWMCNGTFYRYKHGIFNILTSLSRCMALWKWFSVIASLAFQCPIETTCDQISWSHLILRSAKEYVWFCFRYAFGMYCKKKCLYAWNSITMYATSSLTTATEANRNRFCDISLKKLEQWAIQCKTTQVEEHYFSKFFEAQIDLLTLKISSSFFSFVGFLIE